VLEHANAFDGFNLGDADNRLCRNTHSGRVHLSSSWHCPTSNLRSIRAYVTSTALLAFLLIKIMTVLIYNKCNNALNNNDHIARMTIVL